MRSREITLKADLLVIDILCILLIITEAFIPVSALRIILGLPLVLFSPGYVLLSALFPRKEGLSGLQRVALSFGLSIAIVILVGLILNWTPWGLGPDTVLMSLAFFILLTSIIAYLRRRKTPSEQRFIPSFTVSQPQWRGATGLDKALIVILCLFVVGVLVLSSYVVVAPRAHEKFTEFYLLGDYPAGLIVGQEGKVILGIVNHEGREVSYKVNVYINGLHNGEIGPLLLTDEQKWEGEAYFTPQEAGEEQKIEFLLFRDGGSKPYQSVYFFVDVAEE